MSVANVTEISATSAKSFAAAAAVDPRQTLPLRRSVTTPRSMKRRLTGVVHWQLSATGPTTNAKPNGHLQRDDSADAVLHRKGIRAQAG